MDSNLFSDVEIRIKKRNKLFFSRDSLCLQNLTHLIEGQNHRVLVMWALNCARLTLKHFEAEYPHELRPRICLEQCEEWATGKIKMALAKRAILDAHAAAKDLKDVQNALRCHAIAHAGATVHVSTHAIGLPIYELTAIVQQYALKDFQNPVLTKIKDYINDLHYWEKHTDQLKRNWAGFMRRHS